MSNPKKSTIEVQGTAITILSRPQGDYISLTDMVRNFEGGGALIEQWLKSKDTILFLGAWERMHNPDFNSLEFEGIRNEAGRNSFFLSAKSWIERTHAKGLVASAGRYGGTFAHNDIAFELGSWLSPEFKLYLIKEFQRLKDGENRRLSLAWNLNRTLSKLNYRIHTDATNGGIVVKPSFKIGSLIGDHAVLQREMPVPVWGRVERAQRDLAGVGGGTELDLACR